MVKPFDPKELIARVRAILRRTNKNKSSVNFIEFENLKINMDTYSVEYLGEALELPPKEMELLFYLAQYKNNVFTREQLLEQVWGFDYFGDSRTVDVHIKRLREKFPTDADVNWRIKTVWGVGYKFEVK